MIIIYEKNVRSISVIIGKYVQLPKVLASFLKYYKRGSIQKLYYQSFIYSQTIALVHQLVNKYNFDNIKMHGTNVKKKWKKRYM